MEIWNKQNWKKIPFYKGIYVKFPGRTPPESNMSTQKKGPFQKELSSSNHWFAGDMLVSFGGSSLLKSFWHASIAEQKEVWSWYRTPKFYHTQKQSNTPVG